MTQAISGSRNRGPIETECNDGVHNTRNDQRGAQAAHRRERAQNPNAGGADVTVDQRTPDADAARRRRLQQPRSPHSQVPRQEVTFEGETLRGVRTPNGVRSLEVSRAQALTRRQNLEAFASTFASTPLPPTAEQRIANLPRPEGLESVRARQREAVLSREHSSTEILQGAVELGAHVLAEYATTGVTGFSATVATPLAAFIGMGRTVLQTLRDGDEMTEAVVAQGRYERQVRQIRAEGRASYDQGRVDARRADFSEGVRPSAIDWERYASDGDYAQGVRATIENRRQTHNY